MLKCIYAYLPYLCVPCTGSSSSQMHICLEFFVCWFVLSFIVWDNHCLIWFSVLFECRRRFWKSRYFFNGLSDSTFSQWINPKARWCIKYSSCRCSDLLLALLAKCTFGSSMTPWFARDGRIDIPHNISESWALLFFPQKNHRFVHGKSTIWKWDFVDGQCDGIVPALRRHPSIW